MSDKFSRVRMPTIMIIGIMASVLELSCWSNPSVKESSSGTKQQQLGKNTSTDDSTGDDTTGDAPSANAEVSKIPQKAKQKAANQTSDPIDPNNSSATSSNATQIPTTPALPPSKLSWDGVTLIGTTQFFLIPIE